jgi:hypothetical protein
MINASEESSIMEFVIVPGLPEAAGKGSKRAEEYGLASIIDYTPDPSVYKTT